MRIGFVSETDLNPYARDLQVLRGNLILETSNRRSGA